MLFPDRKREILSPFYPENCIPEITYSWPDHPIRRRGSLRDWTSTVSMLGNISSYIESTFRLPGNLKKLDKRLVDIRPNAS